MSTAINFAPSLRHVFRRQPSRESRYVPGSFSPDSRSIERGESVHSGSPVFKRRLTTQQLHQAGRHLSGLFEHFEVGFVTALGLSGISNFDEQVDV